MKLIKTSLFVIGLISMLFQFSCTDEHEFERKSGDNKSKIVYINSDNGEANFKIVTNDSWTLKLDENSKKWARIVGPVDGNGDSTVYVDYDENEGFNRQAVVLVFIPSKSVVDTIYFRQYGLAAQLTIKEESTNFINLGGENLVSVITNLTPSETEKIKTRINYQDSAEGWVENTTLVPTFESLTIEVAPNKMYKDKKAILELVYTDDWGVETVASCLLEQASSAGSSNTRILTFEELRTLIPHATGEIVIEEDVSIAGYAISDYRNHNVAGNPNSSNHAIDRTVNYKTAYLQNEAGTLGVALNFTSVNDNIIKRYDKANIWLQGTVLRKETNPERYTILDVTGGYYIALEEGVASNIVKKEKYIDELTDEDVYTYVTLKDCELPIRKGSFMPINEGYTSRLDYYPLVFRDIKGSSSFLLTNFNCPYRRDGNALPQGSGTISGIVVHEKYERFEKDGFISKYQIRHLEREDIALAQDPNIGFSNVISEWTKFTAGQNKMVLSATGNGELTHSYAAGNIWATNDYDYLLPTEGNKGVKSSNAIANSNWSSGTTLHSWNIKFSTAGISSNNLSLQLATHSTYIEGPRYWGVFVSEDGSNWSKVQDYTVPSIVYWDSTLPTQLCGWKNIDFQLPTSLLGKSEVYIKLQPTNNKAGTQTSYDGGTIVAATTNVLSYISIRYNK